MDKRYICLFCRDYVSDDWREVRNHITNEHGIGDGRGHFLMTEIRYDEHGDPVSEYHNFIFESTDYPGAKVELLQGKPGIFEVAHGAPQKVLDRLKCLFRTGRKWKRRGGQPYPPEKEMLEAIEGWEEIGHKWPDKDSYARYHVGVAPSTLWRWEQELKRRGKLKQ
jgi:hypothetical protein